MPALYGAATEDLLAHVAHKNTFRAETYVDYSTCPGAKFFHKPNKEDRSVFVKAEEKVEKGAEALRSGFGKFYIQTMPSMFQSACTILGGLVLGSGVLQVSEGVARYLERKADAGRRRWSGDTNRKPIPKGRYN
ncbi:unnamed protein product [Amoebophrya sp. A120]|nr:unnamed protein product [Amoebophrya sp. A120]|eukprot:GSA120T00025422001.1